VNSHCKRLLLLIAVSALPGACDRTPQQLASTDLTVLAQAAEGYAQAAEGRALAFPRDHGAHTDYRIEWWYLTANLQDARGEPYGVQWTLFRIAVQPPGSRETGNAWQSDQVFMGHFAITWPDGHQAWQRYARGGNHDGESRAGVTAQPFSAWLDDWTLHSTGSEWLPLEVRARQDGHALQLNLSSDRPLVLQGEQGFSQKHPQGGGSHYYSQPFLQASGELKIGDKTIAVSGPAWLDREWSSQFLRPDQTGWDWFALHLESGEKLMLFRLRPKTGELPGGYLHGVLISPDGETKSLESSRIKLQVLQKNRVAGRSLPLRWRIELQQIERAFEIEALHAEQWMDVDFPYWEGAVTVSGEGPGNRGRGYLELTGYPTD
jgi:predicted secreted hydrolase